MSPIYKITVTLDKIEISDVPNWSTQKTKVGLNGHHFFSLLRFFSRKIEVLEPKNYNFEFFYFFSKKSVNFIHKWRWPKNYRFGICFILIKYWKTEKSLYFDHVTTKKNFHNFFFHLAIYYSPPRSLGTIHPLFL